MDLFYAGSPRDWRFAIFWRIHLPGLHRNTWGRDLDLEWRLWDLKLENLLGVRLQLGGVSLHLSGLYQPQCFSSHFLRGLSGGLRARTVLVRGKKRNVNILLSGGLQVGGWPVGVREGSGGGRGQGCHHQLRNSTEPNLATLAEL